MGTRFALFSAAFLLLVSNQLLGSDETVRKKVGSGEFCFGAHYLTDEGTVPHLTMFCSSTLTACTDSFSQFQRVYTPDEIKAARAFLRSVDSDATYIRFTGCVVRFSNDSR